MKIRMTAVSAGVALLLLNGLYGCSEKPAVTTTPVAEKTPFKPTATLQEIMVAVIDPAADGVWNAVRSETTKKGLVEIQPRTDEEWNAVRNHAITLIEASNLLLIEGRQVAAPGVKSEVPEELHPPEIQKLIDANRTTFNARVHALHAAATDALSAIDAKNPQKLTNAGFHIENACEACHQQFWYPGQKIPSHPGIKTSNPKS